MTTRQLSKDWNFGHVTFTPSRDPAFAPAFVAPIPMPRPTTAGAATTVTMATEPSIRNAGQFAPKSAVQAR